MTKMKVGELSGVLTLDTKGFTSGIEKAQRKLNKLQATSNASKKSLLALGMSVGKVSTKIAAAAVAVDLVVVGFAKWLSRIEGISRRLKSITGTVEANARAWKFLNKTADGLGVGLGTLADSYSNLAAASKGTAIGTKEIESIFLAVSESAAILGLSAQRTRLAFLAFEQMASKNVISMEEVRRQLAEHIPGALNIMARSLDITTAELNKLIASGRLTAEDVLPLFADQIRRENLPALKDLGDTLQKVVGQHETAWFKLKKTVSESFIADAVGLAVKDLTNKINVMNEALKKTSEIYQKIKAAISKFDALFEGKAPKGTIFKIGKGEKKDEYKGPDLFGEEERAKKRDKALNKWGAAAKEALEDFQDAVSSVMENVGSEFTSFISDLTFNADASFSDMLENMGRHILDFTTTMLVVRPILEWFSDWVNDVTKTPGSGLFGKVLAGFGVSNKMSTPNVKALAGGGVISEPVLGVGARSGSGYLLGESGPEAITPLSGSGGGTGGPTNININISAIDSKSVTELLMKNPQAITGPIVEAINSGDRGLSNSLRMAVS
jgi:tape measure domain-containing protein